MCVKGGLSAGRSLWYPHPFLAAGIMRLLWLMQLDGGGGDDKYAVQKSDNRAEFTRNLCAKREELAIPGPACDFATRFP
jgi:hypothetical protein